MPDKRKHRGAHPKDKRLFAESHHAALRDAVGQFSWLLTHGYAEDSSLKLVGDRHDLTARQRMAVMRSACSDQALQRRTAAVVPLHSCKKRRFGIDGYNLLITVESALSGGLILIARDRCCRDLAGIHGTYRKVEETLPAIELIADFVEAIGPGGVDWYLDRPVSNSGRLKAFMADVLEARGMTWNIELVDNPDPVLADYEGIVVSTDSWILDRCTTWANLAAELINARLPRAWKIILYV